MMMSTRSALLALSVLVVLAGCLGGGGGAADDGGATPETPVSTTSGGEGSMAPDGGDGSASNDGGTNPSDGWCPRGQTMQFSNPETGEQAAWEVRGTVQQDGRAVCKVVWETNQGEVRRGEMYFTRDESYQRMVTYDDDGNVVNEVQMSGGDGGSMMGDGGAASGGDGGADDGDGESGDATDAWCTDAQTVEFVNPRTGEQVSWESQGIVEHDGRQVCKAVWETNQGEIRRIEMYFTQDESYRKMVLYDADGNVVNEVQMSGG